MKTNFVSTNNLSQSLRYSLMRMQSELVSSQKEASTARVADLGLALGARTSQSVSMNRDLERLGGIIDQNGLIGSRLTATQNALKQASERAQTFLSTLTAGVGGNANATVTRSDAKGTLDALTSILNTSVNGEQIFAGINTDVKPVASYSAGSPPKVAFDTGFQTFFGFAQTDPAAANITAAQMDSFISTVIEPQFLGAGWQANWSSASDDLITSRIALNETMQTSVNANVDGIRKLTMAATTVFDLFSSETMSVAAKSALLDKAVEMVGDAIADLAVLQSETGLIQQRVTKATERMEMQVDVFERAIGNLEGVDPYEAATRVSTLRDAIETSFTLTARLQQLSLAKFL
jgi:flagellar hook-associated protein 3 FlgL